MSAPPAATQEAASGLRKVEDETKLATNPVGTEDSNKPKEEEKTAVGKAADTATAAATGVKDSVFSMFGGGAKKEKPAETDDVDEPSGSSKVKKAEDDDVRFEVQYGI